MAYVLLLRTDIPDGTLQVLDLAPNSSQVKGNPVHGTPQSGASRYLSDGSDVRVFNSDRATDDAENLVAADSDGDAANDCNVTAAAHTGLSAYLQERVQAGGVAAGDAGAFTAAQANNASAAVLALVGSDMNITAINTALSTIVADTDLDGAAALSLSFGSVAEVLRILSGDLYTVAADTIVTNIAGEFLTEDQRDALVAAQSASADHSSTGSFSQETRSSADNASTALSARSGQLATLKDASFEYLGVAGAAVAVYDDDGNVL